MKYSLIKACFILWIAADWYNCAFAQEDKNTRVWQQIGVSSNFIPLTPKKQILIAIVDDAFDLNHSYLKPYYYKNPKEIPGNNKDDDQNGKIDDAFGWDFSDNDADVNPPVHATERFSHGTKVAGILIQTLEKLCGVSSSFKILPIKTSSDDRLSNYIIDGYAGINYALEQEADIIITSWSGNELDIDKENILKKAQSQHTLIVASAGNLYVDQSVMPAAFPWAIAVGAIDKNNRKQVLSNYGRFVDVVAPADSIATITPFETGFTRHLSGTSAATPIVGGVVAAFMASYPELNASDIDRLLKNTARPLDAYNPLYTGKLGAGLIDVSKLKAYIKTKSISQRFTQAKAYVPLRQSNSEATPVQVSPSGRFPSYKILLTAPSNVKTKINLKTFLNGSISDTTLSSEHLLQPYFFPADSFQIHSTAKRQKTAYLYYEAQAIDSSILFCRDKIIIKGEEGYIEDGSGINNYANRSHCQWLIEVPENKRIQINFEEFDTEAKADQVYIFADDGTHHPILAIFSGPAIPPTITSWYNRVLVWFVTNESKTASGWKLRYQVIDN